MRPIQNNSQTKLIIEDIKQAKIIMPILGQYKIIF